MKGIKLRNKIIKEIYQTKNYLNDLLYKDSYSDDNLIDDLIDKLRKLKTQYISILPQIALSRSPFSNEIYYLSIDTFGLDGAWWDAENPVRAIDNEPTDYFALTGSVFVNTDIPKIPFSVKPGPAVPWVSPRLLENENIVAVLSHIKIGQYDAYPIVYYSKDMNDNIERINTWGTDYYLVDDNEGFALSGNTFNIDDEYDFDIAKWIKKGKLKWINKDDTSLKIQSNLEACPYIDLLGYQYPVVIRNQKLIDIMIHMEYDDEIENNHLSYCPNCGSQLDKEDKYCGNCGTKIN